MTFLMKLIILAVVISPGTFSPVTTWQQVDQQIELLNWVNHQNQLFASGQILSAYEHDDLGMMETGNNDNNGTSSTSALSPWQQAYLAQLQLLATVAAQHQHFISGQNEDDNDPDLTEFESEVQNEEMEMMEIQDAAEENEESMPDEDSTEPALTYH